MRKHDLPITRPFFGSEELEAVQEPLRSGWVVQGPRVAEFEEKFSAFTGAANAVATTSCTTALHLAVRVLGLEPGQEVLVPAFTWVATPNVVEYQGATPVFVDIDLATFNIDPERVEDRVTERCVGIIPVHLFGLCAAMDPLQDVARKHGLWIVEDAACAFGAWIGDRHAGSFGEMGCFSFHPRKSITTGEGGMVTTGDAGLADRLRSLRDHGASRTDLERHGTSGSFLLADYSEVGYNYRMTDLQGALGSVQMDRADWILERRRSLAALYDEALSDIEWLRRPATPASFVHGYQSYVTLYVPEEADLSNVDHLNERRNTLMARLEGIGISTRQGTHAPVLQEAYRTRYDVPLEKFPNAVLADRLSLSLPLAAGMDEDDVAAVADELRRLGP